jgi:hypothetical protein
MYSGTVHLILTVGASLVVVLYCLLQLKDVRPVEWLTIPATFLYANVTEYVAHRGPMHHRFRGLHIVFKDHTLEHHHYFTSEWMEMDGMRDLAAILFPPFNRPTSAICSSRWRWDITPTMNCSTWPTTCPEIPGLADFLSWRGCGCTTRDITTCN